MNLSAFRHSGFRTYFIGNIFALNGLWMLRLSVGWVAWEMSGSASFVGWVAFLFFAPTLVAGPLFGVLIDRTNVKRAALTTQCLQFLLTGLLMGVHGAGALTTVNLSLLACAMGIVGSAHAPVRMSLAPRLVPREAVPSVVALVAINFNLARMTGPAIAGWIIAVWGVDTVMVVQTLTYLPFIVALSLLTPRARRTPAGETPNFIADLVFGFRHAFGDPAIRRPILATGIFAVVIRGALELLPVLADGVFDRGATGLGLLTACVGLGAVTAGLTKALRPAPTSGKLPLGPLLVALVGTASVILLGLSDVWEVTLILVAWLGFAASISGISMQTAIQQGLDDSLRGRVMSIWAMIGVGGAAIGAVLLGWLVDLMGLALTLSVAGSLGALALATLMASALPAR